MPKPTPRRITTAPAKSAAGKKVKSAQVESPTVRKILATLERHRRIGQQADKYLKSREGKIAGIAGFSEKVGFPERTIRTWQNFFSSYPDDQFQRLCKLRRQKSGLPLNSGHVLYLLTIRDGNDVKNSADARHSFAEEAARLDYSPSQLNAAIRRAYGRTGANQGRPIAVDDAPDDALQQIYADAVSWSKRSRGFVDKFVMVKGVAAKPRKEIKTLLSACGNFCVALTKLVDSRVTTRANSVKRVDDAQADLLIGVSKRGPKANLVGKPKKRRMKGR